MDEAVSVGNSTPRPACEGVVGATEEEEDDRGHKRKRDEPRETGFPPHHRPYMIR